MLKKRKYKQEEKLDSFTKLTAKLLPCQKEMILWWWNKGETRAQIHRRFSFVSYRTIDVTIFPEKKADNVAKLKKEGRSYYDSEKAVKAVRESRQRKKAIYHSSRNTTVHQKEIGKTES